MPEAYTHIQLLLANPFVAYTWGCIVGIATGVTIGMLIWRIPTNRALRQRILLAARQVGN